MSVSTTIRNTAVVQMGIKVDELEKQLRECKAVIDAFSLSLSTYNVDSKKDPINKTINKRKRTGSCCDDPNKKSEKKLKLNETKHIIPICFHHINELHNLRREKEYNHKLISAKRNRVIWTTEFDLNLIHCVLSEYKCQKENRMQDENEFTFTWRWQKLRMDLSTINRKMFKRIIEYDGNAIRNRIRSYNKYETRLVEKNYSNKITPPVVFKVDSVPDHKWKKVTNDEVVPVVIATE